MELIQWDLFWFILYNSLYVIDSSWFSLIHYLLFIYLIILYHWLIDSYSNDSVWLILCDPVMGLNWCDLSLYRGGLAERLNRLHSRQRSAISFWRHQCDSTTSAGKTHPVWFMSVYVKTRWWMSAEHRSLEFSSLLLTANDNILDNAFTI